MCRFRRLVPFALAAFLAWPWSIAAQLTVRPLNEGWKTCLLQAGDSAARLGDTLNINLPHNWDDYYGYRQFTHGNLHGSAWYGTKFRVTKEELVGHRVFIRFEGVGSYAQVYLNGVDLGRHPAGRVCLTLDITDAVRVGENRLDVTALHPDLISDLPCVCGGCSSEWGFSEGSQPLGLFRPVRLEFCGPQRVEPFGIHVWNDEQGRLFAETEVKNYADTPCELVLEAEVLDAEGRPVGLRFSHRVALGAGQTTVLRDSADWTEARRWNLDDPYLYTWSSVLKVGDVVCDRQSARFGVRTMSWPVFRADGDGRFFLNGEPVFINGVCEYEHLLGGGHAFASEQIRARVRQIRNAGFNAFRDAHQPHNLEYQEYWDEYGILFWPQLSAHIWYDTPEFRENFKAQLRQWVKERRNSPSVMLWGLQNESVLPESFAKECGEIIREMDPTARTMRPITTCNGGVGSDWNVVQNWSGTYSGNLDGYDEELALPNQLLNGEYGAWRTLDLHEEIEGFRQDGAYSEERFTLLLETKVRLAEAAADRVCGQFQWCFTSHDNPGRRQPEEAYRVIDRVGPVNYKGLLTPWEEPVDAYYMYRSNYVSAEEDPMVFIASHTWPDRFKAAAEARIEVYSNADSVALFAGLDESRPLGGLANPRCIGRHFVFDGVEASPLLRAVAYHRGQAVAEDVVLYPGIPASKAERKALSKLPRRALLASQQDRQPYDGRLLKPAKGWRYLYRVNCGGDAYTDTYGSRWQQDNLSVSRSWGSRFPDLNPYQASQRRHFDAVYGTCDADLFRSFRYGRHELTYRFPLPDGDYRLELYFVEPWHGRGGSACADGLRLFDVAVNGEVLLRDLDIWSEAGYSAALKKTFDVRVEGGEMVLSFPRVAAGQAVISAIAVASADKRLTPENPAYRLQQTAAALSAEGRSEAYIREYLNEWSWEKADADKVARMPENRLPEDRNPRAKVTYEALSAELSGSWEQVYEKSKAGVAFVSGEEEQRIEWTIQVGLAQVYALRFNYRSLTDQSLTAMFRIESADGRVLKESPLTFDPNERGWKALSTTTGSYINAGTYRVILSGRGLEGLRLQSLDVQ